MKYCIYFIVALCALGCSREVPPNVVVLFTDDQRFNTIHALGNSDIYTPNLDRLVHMGVSFSRAHVMGSHHGAVCAPSRAMLLSGRPIHDIPRDYIDLGQQRYEHDFAFLSFPEWFRARGYTTFFTGKWHNHTSKLRTGFEQAENIFVGGMHWPREGGHAKPWLWHQDETGKYATADRWQADQFSSTMFTDAAVNFIQEEAGQKPFCMYVAYSSPHDPRMAPAAFSARYENMDIALPPNFAPVHPFDNGQLRTRDELLVGFPRHPDTIIQEIKAYYAMISEVDAQIGRILNALDEQGIFDNTIIVFAGDNGLALGQHGLMGKQSLYDHSVRVPLIIAGPGIAGYRQASTLAYLHDIFPTLCELVGADIPDELGGISLVPALQDENETLRESVHLTHARQMRAIRTDDDWKLIKTFANGQTHTQLFDLKKDPLERNNLAVDTAWNRIKKDLTHELTRHIIETDDPYFSPLIQSEYQSMDDPIRISIQHPEGMTQVRYTTDDSRPTMNSQEYTEPFALTADAVIKAAVFYGNEMLGEPVETQIKIPTNIERMEWSGPPAAKYAANGQFSLIDGIRGSNDFHAGAWLGYEGEDVSITLALQEAQSLNRVGVGYLQNTGNWIFAPAAIRISVSADGLTYQEIARSQPMNARGAQTFTHEVKTEPIRFIQYELTSIGLCPDGHPGAGKKAWMFVDELIFE